MDESSNTSLLLDLAVLSNVKSSAFIRQENS